MFDWINRMYILRLAVYYLWIDLSNALDVDYLIRHDMIRSKFFNIGRFEFLESKSQEHSHKFSKGDPTSRMGGGLKFFSRIFLIFRRDSKKFSIQILIFRRVCSFYVGRCYVLYFWFEEFLLNDISRCILTYTLVNVCFQKFYQLKLTGTKAFQLLIFNPIEIKNLHRD